MRARLEREREREPDDACQAATVTSLFLALYLSRSTLASIGSAPRGHRRCIICAHVWPGFGSGLAWPGLLLLAACLVLAMAFMPTDLG